MRVGASRLRFEFRRMAFRAGLRAHVVRSSGRKQERKNDWDHHNQSRTAAIESILKLSIRFLFFDSSSKTSHTLQNPGFQDLKSDWFTEPL
jgi:hypothetical protein